MMWLVMQSQTFWNVKSSGPKEALLSIKLVDALRLQQNYSNPYRRMPSRFCIHYVNKSGRPSSGHRIEKGQSSSQSPRRVVPKNVLTIGQLLSSPTLVRSCLKSCVLGFSIMWTKNFQMSKLALEKEEELETNCQHLLDNRESKGISEKHLSLFQRLH